MGTACEVREKPRNWVSDTKEGKHFKGKRLTVAENQRGQRQQGQAFKFETWKSLATLKRTVAVKCQGWLHDPHGLREMERKQTGAAIAHGHGEIS